MPIGTLVRYDYDRGYGFLHADDTARSSRDTFVHVSEFHNAGLPEPEVGNVYEWAIADDERSGKPRAVDLRQIDAEEAFRAVG